MKKPVYAAAWLSVCLALAITGCKKTETTAPADVTVVAAPAAPAAAPAPAATGAAPAAAPSTPAVGASGADPIADLAKIPVITKPLPPFPYIDYPASVHEAHQNTTEQNFDQVHVIVGDKLHPVEGKYKSIRFNMKDANISEFQARRDYTKAALDLGGVKVNTVDPQNEAFVAANGGQWMDIAKKLRWDINHSYDVYFLPTPTGRKWLVLMITDGYVRIISLEEKQEASSVKLVTAAAMKSALDSKGHIALYINFDTDKAVIRADGKPAVDEIATLMKQEAALRLKIEGHTDNVGDSKRNMTLSRERAEAVVKALVADGIDSVRLSAAGHGADKPVADNASDEGRAMNRRVELVKQVKS